MRSSGRKRGSRNTAPPLIGTDSNGPPRGSHQDSNRRRGYSHDARLFRAAHPEKPSSNANYPAPVAHGASSKDPISLGDSDSEDAGDDVPDALNLRTQIVLLMDKNSSAKADDSLTGPFVTTMCDTVLGNSEYIMSVLGE